MPDAAGVPYAVAGGNAVAGWVGRVDVGAVRNTRDVDLLIRRGDLAAVRKLLPAVPASSQVLIQVNDETDLLLQAYIKVKIVGRRYTNGCTPRGDGFGVPGGRSSELELQAHRPS